MSATTNNDTPIRKYMFNEYDGQPVIGCDIDEVLWSVMPSYLAEISKLTGVCYSMDQMTEYNMSKTLNVHPSIINEVLHNTDAFCRVTPYRFSESLIRNLREGIIPSSFGLPREPHYVALVTHRGFRADGLIKTLDLLKQFNIIPDALVAAPMTASKLDVMDDLYGDNISLMIEDCPPTIYEFLAAGIPVVKQDQPWNRSVWTDYTIDLKKQLGPLDYAASGF